MILPEGNRLLDKGRELQSQAASGPWRAKQYPRIANWLKANAKPLALISKGAKRPKYFSPLVISTSAEKSVENTLLACPLPALQQSRSVARALSARAMLHTAEGRTQAAWHDLQTCHRLGRMVGRGPTLIEALVGYAIDANATRGEVAFIQYTRPNRTTRGCVPQRSGGTSSAAGRDRKTRFRRTVRISGRGTTIRSTRHGWLQRAGWPAGPNQPISLQAGCDTDRLGCGNANRQPMVRPDRRGPAKGQIDAK